MLQSWGGAQTARPRAAPRGNLAGAAGTPVQGTSDPGRDAPSLCDLAIPPSCKTAMMRTPVAQCTVFRRTPETSWWQSFKGSNNFLEMYFCVLPFSSIQALRHPLCLHFNPTALEIRILRPENIDWGKFLSLPRPVWWLWPWLWPWEKKQESMATQDPPTPAFPKIPPASLALQNS